MKKAKKVNGYSLESLKKVVSALKSAKDKYMSMPIESIKLCISNGNRKIGKAMNVSLPPILSCGNCKECKHFCYDIRACLQYKNVIDARIRNYVILLRDRDLYFSTIDRACSRRKTNKMFRWHVSGDIIDLDYFCRMVEIAKNHPDFIFWTYTKMYNIVNEYCDRYGKESIPVNFSVMFSEWRGVEMVNPYGFGEFRALYENESIPENTYYCPGNCDICKAARRGCIANENTCIYIH